MRFWAAKPATGNGTVEQGNPATLPGETSRSTFAVSLRGVSKEFRDGDISTWALHDLDLDLHWGELTLLVGPSGCGKTTLITIIAGLLQPTTGEVRVLGRNLNRLSKGELIEFRGQNVGFVFQQFNLLPALTATENVAVPLIIAGLTLRESFERSMEILKVVGLGDRLHSLPNRLSSGQQQRVAIARALVREPRLLVCDEPTASLDAESGHTIMELLRKVALEPERAVLVVTHDYRIFSFGDRIVTMNDGGIERIEVPESSPNRPNGNLNRVVRDDTSG